MPGFGEAGDVAGRAVGCLDELDGARNQHGCGRYGTYPCYRGGSCR